MLIAKKIFFMKRELVENEQVYTNFGESALYIPVSGYTKDEITAMWDNANMITLLNDVIDYGLIGAGWPCLNPGVENGNIYDTYSYKAFCEPRTDRPLLCGNNTYFTGLRPANGANFLYYVNNPSDRIGLVLNPRLMIGLWNGTSYDFNWTLNLMTCLGLGQKSSSDLDGGVCLFICSSDEKFGFWRLNNLKKGDSYLRWMTDAENERFRVWLDSLEPMPLDEDPFSKGGVSDTNDTPGDFERDGEDVDIPPLPEISAAQSNFISIYNPTLAQLKQLSTYMWSSDLVDIVKKLFSNPMDAIIGLSIVPVSVPNAGNRIVCIGNATTPVSMPLALSQYVEIDCGTAILPPYFGAYLDYSPYTKIEVYLPYIGVRPLDADEVVGKTITIKYHVDILSGACCAYLKIGGTVLYTFIGQCSASIPITGSDFTNVVNGALNIGTAIGMTVATGGLSAPMALGTIANTALNGSMKPQIEKSGAISGVGGFFGVQKPYLIVTTPRQCLPANQNKFIGYPSFITATLGNLQGYTEIESVHLENIPATEEELSEIEELLKTGVIF